MPKKVSAKKSSVKKSLSKKDNVVVDDVASSKNLEGDNNSKRKNNNFQIIGIVLGLIMLGVVLFFLKSQSVVDDEYAFYNGYFFDRHPQLDNVWLTNINLGSYEQRMEFRYHPLDLEHFSYDDDVNQYLFLSQLSDGSLYVSFSSDVLDKGSGYISLAGYDISRVLRSFLGFDVFVGAENFEDYEWVSCDDASIDNFVILFKEGEPRIESMPFCAIIYFDEPEDALKLSSLFLYKLFGVMN